MFDDLKLDSKSLMTHTVVFFAAILIGWVLFSTSKGSSDTLSANAIVDLANRIENVHNAELNELREQTSRQIETIRRETQFDIDQIKSERFSFHNNHIFETSVHGQSATIDCDFFMQTSYNLMTEDLSPVTKVECETQ